MWEKEIWIAKRKKVISNDMGVDIECFETPIRYALNYQPISGTNNFQEYGEKVSDVYRAFVKKIHCDGEIKVGDRVYLSDGNIMESELKALVESDNEFCNKANYVVNAVLSQNFFIRIDFLKRR